MSKEENTIENLIFKEEYEYLAIEEKKELLLGTIKEYLIEEANKLNITFIEESTTIDMLIGLNFIYYTYKDRKKFNTKLISSIINIMSNIQGSTIKYIKTKDISTKFSPVYTYDEKGNLLYIIGYNKIDNLSVLLSLIEYIEKRFMVTNTRIKKYKIH